jgi:hypothetical protein
MYYFKLISNLSILLILDLYTTYIKKQSTLLTNYTNHPLLFSNDNINDDYILGFNTYLNLLEKFNILEG